MARGTEADSTGGGGGAATGLAALADKGGEGGIGAGVAIFRRGRAADGEGTLATFAGGAEGETVDGRN
jgi:hypothetical protein